MYNTVDLFAGAGGLSLGFQQTGKFDIKIAFENNPIMQATYRKNYPNTKVFGDVREADYEYLEKEFGPIDIIIGGPPCQGFSNANRQKNQTISLNNALVKEFVRAITELRPKAFVMENVSMLRSDVHRFYLSDDTKNLFENGLIRTKISKLLLLEKDYLFDGILDIIKDQEQVLLHMWPQSDFHTLNVIFKVLKNENKLVLTLNKRKKQLLKIAENHLNNIGSDKIFQTDQRIFNTIVDYFNGKSDLDSVKTAIIPAVKYQKMLHTSMEIFENNIIVDDYIFSDGLIALIKSFSVFDYFKAMLEGGNTGYHISSGTLSAADFGAPQKRVRFIAVGIRNDISSESRLPSPKFTNYRTVRDAIEDIEDVPPVVNTSDDNGILLEKKDNLSDLAYSLRDTQVLYNHIITKTSDTAMERFKLLKQGENFHSLPDEMKNNTYTNVARTQNTVYQRLKYDEPSGTVVNVRKSMWIHPTLNRAVSVREAARLQTFPDSFVFEGTKDKQYQQVGNAVPPVLAKAIAESLAEQLE